MLSRDLSKCEISAYAIEIIEKEKTLRDKVILVKLEECDAPCTIGHLPSVDYHLLNDYLFGEPEISGRSQVFCSFFKVSYRYITLLC